MRVIDLLGRHFHAEDGDRRARAGIARRRTRPCSRASVVLPIEGRPATMTRSPARRPPVSLSNSVKPVRQAAQLVGIVVPLIDLVDDAPAAACAPPPRPSRLRKLPSAISNTCCSARSTSSRAVSTVVVEHRRSDVGAGTDQLPQQRALAHDVRVGAHIGGGRRVARDGAQVGEAAGAFELAGALELLRDRDDVAGLGLTGKVGDRRRRSAGDRDDRSPRATTRVGDVVPGAADRAAGRRAPPARPRPSAAASARQSARPSLTPRAPWRNRPPR